MLTGMPVPPVDVDLVVRAAWLYYEDGLTQAQVAIEHVVDGDAVQGVDLLAHMGDAPVGRQQAVPGIRGQLTQQQGEQRGFSGAVGTDQAGFVTGVQGQLGVFKKTLRATL